MWESSGERICALSGEKYAYAEALTIKQFGQDISGSTIYLISGKENEENKSFQVNGFLKNDVLVAIYENPDNQSVGIGTYTLLLKDDCLFLEGVCTVYNVSSRNIEDWLFKFARKRNNV